MSNDGFHLSDKALVTSILNGNIGEFAVVVSNTEKLVAHIVRKMTANADDQQDLVQEIYLKAYQKLSTFQFQSKLSTWVAQIAYNTTVNYLQKKQLPFREIDVTIERTYPMSENVETTLNQAETKAILRAEIDQLPPLYQTLITLYHLDELPNREIAEITSLPEGTIKSYLSRARKMLKDSIQQQYRTDEL